MNRIEAIILLAKHIANPSSVDIMDVNAAEQIGIEALEYFDKLCQSLPAFRDVKLPSETEE